MPAIPNNKLLAILELLSKEFEVRQLRQMYAGGDEDDRVKIGKNIT